MGASQTSKVEEASNTESDATYNYYAFAAPGSSKAASVWKVIRVDIATGAIKTYADGNANYDNVGQGLAALSYS